MPAAKEVAEPKTYHVGVERDCPFECLHLAGQDFPLITEHVETTPGAGTRRTTLPGKLIQLTEQEVKDIKAASERKMFRWTGDRATIVDKAGTHQRPYRPDAGDEPVSEYIYIREVDPEQIILPYGYDLRAKQVAEGRAGERRGRQRRDDAGRRAQHKAAKRSGQRVKA